MSQTLNFKIGDNSLF